MSEPTQPSSLGINSWLEDELYQQYLYDRKTVDESWKKVFESNGAPAPQQNGSPTAAASPAIPALAIPASVPKHQPAPGEELIPMRGPALRLAENMTASLSIPTATSQRNIPVKVIDENRRILNEHRALMEQSKISTRTSSVGPSSRRLRISRL
jgi:2-oxoglutarate dehydrogenase E1 component